MEHTIILNRIYQVISIVKPKSIWNSVLLGNLEAVGSLNYTCYIINGFVK